MLFRSQYPAVYERRLEEIRNAGRALVEILQRNVFPEMKIAWGTYPNNIGHTYSPGCFRCHDDGHADAAGKTIPQDCNSCHQLLAMEEAAPKILTDLGATGTENQPSR